MLSTHTHTRQRTHAHHTTGYTHVCSSVTRSQIFGRSSLRVRLIKVSFLAKESQEYVSKLKRSRHLTICISHQRPYVSFCFQQLHLPSSADNAITIDPQKLHQKHLQFFSRCSINFRIEWLHNPGSPSKRMASNNR